MANDNPLLDLDGLPRFAHIEPSQITPALDAMLDETRATVEARLSREPRPGWEDAVGPLEAAEARLKRFWSPVAHLNAVADSAALREAYNAGLGRLTSYQTGYAQDERVYRAYQAVADGPDFAGLSEARRKVVTNALRDMRLSGPTGACRAGRSSRPCGGPRSDPRSPARRRPPDRRGRRARPGHSRSGSSSGGPNRHCKPRAMPRCPPRHSNAPRATRSA